jgi:hypothetical protein
MRGIRASQIIENPITLLAITLVGLRDLQIPPAHPRSQHSMLLKLIQVGYSTMKDFLFPISAPLSPSEAFLSLDLSLTPYPSSVLSLVVISH